MCTSFSENPQLTTYPFDSFDSNYFDANISIADFKIEDNSEASNIVLLYTNQRYVIFFSAFPALLF